MAFGVLAYQFDHLEDAGNLAEIIDIESGRAGDGGVHRVGVVAADDAVIERLGRRGHHFFTGDRSGSMDSKNVGSKN